MHSIFILIATLIAPTAYTDETPRTKESEVDQYGNNVVYNVNGYAVPQGYTIPTEKIRDQLPCEGFTGMQRKDPRGVVRYNGKSTEPYEYGYATLWRTQPSLDKKIAARYSDFAAKNGLQDPGVTTLTAFVPLQSKFTKKGFLEADMGLESVSTMVVRLHQDKFGRVIGFSTEVDKPVDKANPETAHVYCDPSYTLRPKDGKGEPMPLPPGDLTAPNDSAKADEYQRLLDQIVSRANMGKCRFYKDHSDLVRYARDPDLVSIDAFIKSCEDAEDKSVAFPGECKKKATEGVGAIGNAAALVGVMSDDDQKEKANQQFNLELIHEYRKGLINTQFAIFANTAPGVSGIEDFKYGWVDSYAGACDIGATRNAELDYRTKQMSAAYKKGDPEVRADLERQHAKQMMKDVLALQWSRCLIKHWSYGSSNGTHPRASPYYNGVRNNNKLLGWMEEGKIDTTPYDFYKVVKENLLSQGIGKKYDWGMFEYEADSKENRMHCSRDGAEYEMMVLLDQMDNLDLTKLEPVINKVRQIKRETLVSTRKELNDYTDQCEDASKMYEHHWIRKDKGLKLWLNDALVKNVARKYVKKGDDLSLERFKWVYHRNCENKEVSEKWRNRALIGATAIAIVVPIGGELIGGTVAAGTALAAQGMAATLMAGDVLMSSKMYRDAQEKLGMLRTGYLADINEINDLDPARAEVASAGVMLAASILLSPVDIISFGKAFARALKVGRPLTHAETEAYKYISDLIRKNKISSDMGESFIEAIRRCSPASKSCANEAVLGLLSRAAKTDVEKSMLAAATASAAESNAAPVFGELDKYYGKFRDQPVKLSIVDRDGNLIEGEGRFVTADKKAPVIDPVTGDFEIEVTVEGKPVRRKLNADHDVFVKDPEPVIAAVVDKALETAAPALGRSSKSDLELSEFFSDAVGAKEDIDPAFFKQLDDKAYEDFQLIKAQAERDAEHSGEMLSAVKKALCKCIKCGE
jgi:hypothetical protein